MSSRINLRLAEISDCLQISEIHRREIPAGLLSQINQGSLIKIYKNWLENCEGKILLALDDDRNLIGFCAILLNYSVKKSFSFHGKLTLGIALAKNFKYLDIAASNLFNWRNSETCDNLEIVAFAVLREWQGKGIGQKLLSEIPEVSQVFGAKLVMTKTHNVRLGDFYIKEYGAKIVLKQEFKAYSTSTLLWPVSAMAKE